MQGSIPGPILAPAQALELDFSFQKLCQNLRLICKMVYTCVQMESSASSTRFHKIAFENKTSMHKHTGTRA